MDELWPARSLRCWMLKVGMWTALLTPLASLATAHGTRLARWLPWTTYRGRESGWDCRRDNDGYASREMAVDFEP